MPETPPLLAGELQPDVADLRDRLAALGWLGPGEEVSSVDHAGAGNMNRTLRVTTDRRSLIVKQSRPYVVKFPDIPAPVERLEIEARFYAIASQRPALAAALPELLAFDPTSHIALIEDLGKASDLTSLYAEGSELSETDRRALFAFAGELHAIELSDDERNALRNHAMRALNHEHIFDLPLRAANGLELDEHAPGLQALAESVQRDDRFRRAVHELGDLYLSDPPGSRLLHGDYYPGSFLATPGGVRVIDPEFAFPGPPEFDLGVFAAHRLFAGEAPEAACEVDSEYGRVATLDRTLLRGFAGTEVMRRLLGVAQLPLDPGAGLRERERWLEVARTWVVEP